MSAHEQMRQMLDQLMGTGRDGENNRYKVKFADHRVCKSFLLACCPHDILASTRMDLGDCPKIHDLALRADYEQASNDKDYYYDIDAMEHLQAFINDCDRRTELAKRRLAETQEELSAEVAAKANKVHELAEQIGKKLAKAEQLGADGNVEESLKLMEEVEDYRKKKASAEQEYRNSMPASSYQQQKLRVCEVCSAYLGIHDNDRRLADHFGGKLHLGFIRIREHLADLVKMVSERKDRPPRGERGERGERGDRGERDDGCDEDTRRFGPVDNGRGGAGYGRDSSSSNYTRRSRSPNRQRGGSVGSGKRARSRSHERHRERSRSNRSRERSRRRSSSRDRSRRSSRDGRRRSRSRDGRDSKRDSRERRRDDRNRSGGDGSRHFDGGQNGNSSD